MDMGSPAGHGRDDERCAVEGTPARYALLMRTTGWTMEANMPDSPRPSHTEEVQHPTLLLLPRRVALRVANDHDLRPGRCATSHCREGGTKALPGLFHDSPLWSRRVSQQAMGYIRDLH